MSAEQRKAIADAASTVSGVNVSPYFRQTTKTGEGFVRLDRTIRDESGFGFMDNWNVVIVLSSSISTAEKWIEDNCDALIEAISEEMVITQMLPQQLVIDNGTTLPVLFIEGARAK